MAAEDGVYPARWENQCDFKVMTPEDFDELRMLMEKLQSRSSQNRNWTEIIKAVIVAITNDKRCQSDALERSSILSCVDKLQKAIKVENQQTLLEKLESIARQQSLMFNPPALPDKPASISCEMFTVEISMDTKGVVKDVRVCHQGEAMSNEELTEVLSREQYDEFSGHLQGFLSIYKIPGDKKQKSKAYLALQSLETDLNDLAQLQSSIKGVSNCIHKSPLGILLPRKGGYPMKLIYFVSPYDLLDKRSNSPHPLTVEAITEYECGQSVTVCIQQCSVSSRLQTMPLMSVVTQDGKSLPSFQALSNVNSCMLSACFVLVLPQPIPVALSVVRLIKNVTNLDVITVGEENSLITLLLKDVFKCKAEDEFFVTLPDQQHVFYMNDINGCSLEQPAVMVSKIPFTHPTNVAQVLNCLRQQLIFNTVIGSSIRPNASQECSVVFELNALSLQQMTLSFEHPLHNTMVTAEIDLSDITYPKFKVIYSEEEQSLCSEDLAGKIFQRCLSVPVTLRSVINKVSDEIRKEPPPEPVSVTIPADRPPPWPPEYYSSHFSPGRIPMDLKNISPNNMAFRNYGLQHSPQISYNLGNLMSGIGSSIQPSLPQEGILIEPPAPEKPHNPLLADLLDRNSPSPTPDPIQNLPQSEAPIMSKLLEDSNASAMASSIPQPPTKAKQVRRKRISKGEAQVVGRSPKQLRMSDQESNGSIPHLDFDSSGGSFDFGDVQNPGPPHSIHSHGHPTLTRQLSIIDLTDSQADTPAGFSGESEMQKLESMVGNKLPRQPHRQDSELSQLLSDYGDTSPAKETQSPHHYYHNSVPKNDKVSTSREDKILSGSREVLKTTDPTSPNYAHQSLMDLLSIKQEEPESSYNFQRQNSNISMISLTSNEPSNRKLSHGSHVRSNSMSDLSDSDTFPYKEKSCDSTAFNAKTSNKNPALAANSDSSISLKIKQEVKEENVHDLRTLLTIGKEKAENNVIDKDKFKKEEGTKNIRLKVSTVQGLRQSSLPNELLNTGINKKSKAPFDFHSDDDDDDPFDFRDKMKVVSSSPTRLHIHKQKLYNHKLSKEKDKKKDSKNNIVSGEKRKKDKNESKKERKKKQKMMENYKSTSLDESAIYKSVTVVSEDSNSSSNLKPIPKLKINKSSLGISVGKSPSREVLTSKNETVKKSKEKYDKHLSSSKKSSSQKAYKVHQQSSPSNSITVSKADSKLITKTPTIKLKPIAMPTSSSVSVGSAKNPPAYSTASSTKGSTTPTTTTIGRMGAVSLTKSGSLTPPASVKASTPTSLSKSFPNMKSSSKSTSSLPSAAKIPSQRSNSSSSNRGSSDNKESKKERNGSSNSSKNSSVRKSSSPMAGSRNPMNLSKSSHSSNKNLSSSTSSPFSNKNQSPDVLSFLNRDSSVIANLPKIPKMAKTNTAVSSGTNKSQTTESISKAVTSSVSVNSKVNSTSTVCAKTNLTNSSINSSKSAVSTSVSNSRTNSVQNTKPSISTSSSPAHTKTVTTPTSVKQTPFISKSNNVIPSCSGGFSRSVTTVTCTTSSSSKLVTSTSSTTSSKMATSVSPTVTSSVSRSSSSSNPSTSVSKSVSSSSSSSGSDSVKKTTQNSTTPSSGTIATGSAQNTNQLSSNPISHKSRPRKGSLTAVIDKLTKQTSYECGSEDVNKQSVESVNQESSLSSLNESDKNVVNCRTEKTDATTHNSKSAQDKISKDSNVQGKIRKDDKEAKNNNSSPKTKSCENVKKRSDSPSKTNSGKENIKNDDSRNLFTSILKSASENSYSPKDKGSKSNDGKGVVDLSKSEECSSSSEVRNSNTNCEMESSQCEKFSNTNKHSRTPSPKQNPKKFNGETVTREGGSDHKSKDSDVFKVPSPKAHNSDDIEDTENYVIRKKQRISTSKPVLSPSSPVSSPELVIDCQTLSPRTLQNKTNSPNIEVSSDKVGNNTILKTKNASPIHKVKQSQLQSPVLIKMEHHTASPSEIDDDLMNEALIGFGS
ncbi:mediator of RNA polymerase II transcription subunit 1-like [Mytilus trossulus]|uniref:mediator of RNA polymerase II transcription subunit 1-like n=1 Tax=Mytilus trossulus TaxID=6551 RepID=UPI00300558A2